MLSHLNEKMEQNIKILNNLSNYSNIDWKIIETHIFSNKEIGSYV